MNPEDPDPVSPNHYIIPQFKQRMTTKEWRWVLLNKRDLIIFHGQLTPLKARYLGAGVYEVSKELEGMKK